MEFLVASMVNVGWGCREIFLGQLVKVGLMECATRICGFTLTIGEFEWTLDYSMWTSLWSHSKNGVPWSFQSVGLLPLV